RVELDRPVHIGHREPEVVNASGLDEIRHGSLLSWEGLSGRGLALSRHPAAGAVLSLGAMQCPRCQHEPPPRAKFCPECATPLPARCAKCEGELPVAAKFCPQCAAPVGAPPDAAPRFASPASYTPTHLAERIRTSKDALEGERKHVTVLFADLKGSMELLADRDPEDARRLLDAVLERMIEAG